MAEKRTHPHPGRRLIVDFASGGISRTGFTHDISYTGLFIASAHLPSISESLSVTLRLGEESGAPSMQKRGRTV